MEEEPMCTLLMGHVSQSSLLPMSSSMACIFMIAYLLEMPWWGAPQPTLGGGQWLMEMPSPYLAQATFGLTTTPCLTVLMALWMLSWAQQPLLFQTTTSPTTMRYFHSIFLCQSALFPLLNHGSSLYSFANSGDSAGPQWFLHKRQAHASDHRIQPFRRGTYPENATVIFNVTFCIETPLLVFLFSSSLLCALNAYKCNHKIGWSDGQTRSDPLWCINFVFRLSSSV